MAAVYVGMLLAAAALCMFSFNILLIKQASNRISLNLGFLISVVVNVLFCGLLLGVQLGFAPHNFHWSWYGALMFGLGGIFSTYLGRWLFFEAVVRLGSAKASLFQVSSPGFAAVIAWVFLGESISPIGIGAILLTMAGLALIVYVPGASMQSIVDVDHAPAAVKGSLVSRIKNSHLTLGAGAAIAYAVSTVIRGAAVRSWNEPLVGALLGALTGLLLHVALSSEMRTFARRLRDADRRGVRMFMVSGVLTILAQICSIWSLRYIEVSLSNLITLCTPLLVIPGGYLLFKEAEPMPPRAWLGGAMALGGVAILILVR